MNRTTKNLESALVAIALALALASACGRRVVDVGSACTGAPDCEYPNSCVTEFRDGFCTRGCDEEGSARTCPGGSVCASLQGTLYCAPTCGGDVKCRDGYECAAVPGSDAKACKPTKQ